MTAQQLKDGFRGIGRMVVTPVHVSIKKEIVKFGPPRTTFRAPDAKKLKYVALLVGIIMCGVFGWLRSMPGSAWLLGRVRIVVRCIVHWPIGSLEQRSLRRRNMRPWCSLRIMWVMAFACPWRAG